MVGDNESKDSFISLILMKNQIYNRIILPFECHFLYHSSITLSCWQGHRDRFYATSFKSITKK